MKRLTVLVLLAFALLMAGCSSGSSTDESSAKPSNQSQNKQTTKELLED